MVWGWGGDAGMMEEGWTKEGVGGGVRGEEGEGCQANGLQVCSQLQANKLSGWAARAWLRRAR